MLPNVTPAVLLRAVAILLCTVTFVSAANDEFNIELKQKDAEVYHEQNIGRNEFNYGYQVERTNSQFQHKAKGPDDVTYGCYGYIDPDGEKHLVYYIADRLGYRLLAPDQPTKVFTDRVANSVNKLDADLQGRKLDEKVVAWNDLYLPSTCRRLNEIVSITPPPTPVPVPITTARPAVVAPVNPVTPFAPQPSDTQKPTDFFPSSTSSEPNFDGDNSGTDKVVVPPIVDETHNGGLKIEVGGSTEPPQEFTDIGTGVSESPYGESGVGNQVANGGLNNGDNAGDDNSARNENAGGRSQTTVQPTPKQEEVYRPPQPTSPRPTPAPIQIEPIVPSTLPSPQVPSREREVHTAHPNRCDNAAPNSEPFASGPKYPATIGQFNGFVFPINRDCDASGRSTADLLAQMQAINELVLKVSGTLHALSDAPADAHNGTCARVLELLNIQQPVPLLVYVPIMIPYLDGGIHGAGSVAGAQKPPINPASYAYAQSCRECK